MIPADLKGRAVLVTGGASGIGLAAVELFAKCGALVAMNHLAEDSRAPAEIERLTRAGRNIVSAPGNVSVPGEAERMVKNAIEQLGRLDVLINNGHHPCTAERTQATVDQTLPGRLATPADMAEAMLFLAAGAAYVTGETLAVAGGLN